MGKRFSLVKRLHISLLVPLLVMSALVSGGAAFAQDSAERTTITLAAGDPIQIQGQVLTTDGIPIEGTLVEIWHTDSNGRYNHPNDSSADQLIEGFQYFGAATTDADGNYAFLTLKPAAYENRPTHIHVKVFVGGTEVLTTQFYFADEETLVAADGVTQGTDDLDSLFLALSEVTDSSGTVQIIGTGDLVIDMNGNGADALTPTPAQTEGPYYPVIDFSSYDNNLTSTAEGDATILPILDDELTSMVAFTLLNLNTATADELMTIPNMGGRMIREFEEYRPYVSIQQFRREIGKYVDAATVAGYEQYVYVPIDVDGADAATLMQIPGIDQTLADALIAGRPYGSNEAFLAALGGSLSAEQVALASAYLATP
jgi:protocatechuate 3,4-dioxygenase beta subunit